MSEKKQSPHKLSTIFGKIDQISKEKPLTFASLVDFLGDQSHGFMILFLSLPFVLPFPIPGMSIPFGIAIAVVAITWLLDRNPWLPKRFHNHAMSAKAVHKICHYGQKMFSKIEFLIRPRMEFMFDQKVVRLLLVFVILCSSLFLALPLPPGTNFPPGIVILILSLSIIERDGLFAILGMSIFSLCLYWFWNVSQYLLIQFGLTL